MDIYRNNETSSQEMMKNASYLIGAHFDAHGDGR